MPFGNQIIQAVDIEQNTSVPPDELGNYPLTETVTAFPGCRHRPLTFKETAELEFDIATQPYKSTIPVFEYSDLLRNKLRTIANNDVIRVDGKEFQIIGGVEIFPDMSGDDFKATIISERKVG